MNGELMVGCYYGTITLDDIISHSVSMTLADEKVSHGGLILRDMAVRRVAHEHDVQPRDIEILSFDSMHVLSPREMKEPAEVWDIEMDWVVWCFACSQMAAFDNPNRMCHTCERDAYEQELADQENDDRAIGLV